MKFLKLEIKNLASLDRQDGETINFDKGALGESTIFSIVGATGSGKSTILDAICLALYNRAPRYPRKKGERNQNIEIFGELESDEKNRLAPTDARNILTRGKKEGFSKLTFLANNGVVYRAEWYVRQKIKSYDEAVTLLYKIVQNNGIQSEETAAWNELPQIIGLDYEQFLRTVLIAQGSFANFLTSKENERYELLEKLIGCEGLYSNIALKIKQQRDEAAHKYDQIVALFSAQVKDIIQEDELAQLKNKIVELVDVEDKAKKELERVRESIKWYEDEDNHIAKIAGFEQSFSEAKQQIEALREESDRLALHDAVQPALTLLGELKKAEENIRKCDKDLLILGQKIAAKEEDVKKEEESLAKLNQVSEETSLELEKQKPHINKAREIKVELDGLKRLFNEKESAKNDAAKAKDKADKELADNEKAIAEATRALKQFKQEQCDLLNKFKNEETIIKQKAEKAFEKYNQENGKLQKCDAAKLQEAKTCAVNTQTDLNTAIRIQNELKIKSNQKENYLNQKQLLTERNNKISEHLKTFEIEKLKNELDTLTKSYTLMTSEKWVQHRSLLVEGQACPLCGATDHPYHNDETITPVIDEMKKLVDEKRINFDKQNDKRQQLANELATNNGLIEGIKNTLRNLDTEILKLNNEWYAINELHKDWYADVVMLKSLIPETEKCVEETENCLKEFNNLTKTVERLRKEKEMAEGEKQNFEHDSLEKQQKAEKKVSDAYILLETENGKSENLRSQQNEKVEALTTAIDVWLKTSQEFNIKEDALKQEIGDKDPDEYEKLLNNAKIVAEKTLKDKYSAIALLREQLKEIKGEEFAIKNHKEDEFLTLSQKKDELSLWLSKYNAGRTEQLTNEVITSLFVATDNWEEIRDRQKRTMEYFTSTKITLENEIKVHDEHQAMKPEQSKEELIARKTEIESLDNTELVDAKARLQRHNDAVRQMGAMVKEKQKSEEYKREWDEINNAIGSEGKTLRKIAQCYTLRFLIEHANVEIRKFNSRYELQQVKNSLGIRVIDHDRADDVRDTTSLSGGETFIVSLGLALGLSALSSRNISFDNLFIDEGFGTLDPDTLATVIDSLSMLQSSQGKKVGVISHTDTMSERITTQIRIIKQGNSGSSHIEVYPNE